MQGLVTVRACPDPRSQYTEMAQEMKTLLSRGAAPGSIAVLIRNTMHIGLLLDVLQQNRIPVGQVAAATLRGAVPGNPHTDAGRASVRFSAKNGKSEDPSSEALKNGISVMTMHAAKGLEFDHVFLPDLNEGILPGSRARKPSEIEEERRIFYVAMTRASRTLFLSYCETRRRRKTAPSRFLEDLLQK